MHPEFEKYLLITTGAKSCKEVEVIQSLWSGYGKISRYELKNANVSTVVVKNNAFQNVSDHPRGWNSNKSHSRKVKSYEVETNWYQNWNHQSNFKCRTAKFLGSHIQGKEQWIILEDLSANFPLRKNNLNFSEVKACLSWLANFHATYMDRKPIDLWEVGTYWHLDTRPDELKEIEDIRIKSIAPKIDQLLNKCKFQTIVHGDAKLANFCFSEDGKKVSAVDFQYVGGGCGMKDVSYFMGSCLSSNECMSYEKELLQYYFSELKNALDISKPDLNFSELQSEWSQMYNLACADFTRFMIGWMPSHQKLNPYSLRIMEEVLELLDI